MSARILDLSQVRDSRFKSAGFSVDETGRARSAAVLCEWFLSANQANGGTNPFPYGLLLAQGDPADLQDLPPALQGSHFVELVVADQEDPRAARLTWNETRTEASFRFVLVAAALGIDHPEGAAMWFDVYRVQDQEGLPVLAVPIGQAQTRAIRRLEAAAGTEPAPIPAQ